MESSDVSELREGWTMKGGHDCEGKGWCLKGDDEPEVVRWLGDDTVYCIQYVKTMGVKCRVLSAQSTQYTVWKVQATV